MTLRSYVNIKKDKDTAALKKAGFDWVVESSRNKISYEIDWMGIPIIQTPADMVLMQELIWNVQPDYVIDVGVAHGGSCIYYASLLKLINSVGFVVGVDVDIRVHNRKAIEDHLLSYKIKLIEGDSTSLSVIKSLQKVIPEWGVVVVCLDSAHTKSHVLKELELYKDFVKKDGYIVVFDTITSKLSEFGVCDRKYARNGPLEAVELFLDGNKDFVMDRSYNKLYTSYSHDGYLRRVR